MAVARKIAYNVAFNSGAKVVSTILALVGVGLVTRYLGKEGFGNYAIALAFFSLFGALADLGLYSVATREISRKGADEKVIMGKIFALRIIASLLVFVLSPLIVIFLPYSDELKIGIIISAAAFVFTSSYMVLNGIFQKNLAMYKVATVEVVGKVIQVSLIALVIQKDMGFIAIMVAFLVASAFNSITIFIRSRHYMKFKLQIDLAYWKKFLQLSFPMGLSVIITFMYFKMDTILLSFFQDKADVGIYNAAYKIIENLVFFPAMIIGLIFPLMSRYIFSDKKKFINISDKTFKIFFVLVVPLIVGTLFLADGIIYLIGGAEFSQSAEVLRILIFSLAFIFFGHFFNYILLAGNLQKKLVIALFFSAVFSIIANLIFIPLYSYIGAAYTSVATEMVVIVLTFYLTHKYLGYKPKLKNMSNVLVSGFAMALFLLIFRGYNIFILAAISSAIYLIALWMTKAVTTEELRILFSRNSIKQNESS